MTVVHLAPSRPDHALRSLLSACLVLLSIIAAGRIIASVDASDGEDANTQSCGCNFILPDPYH